MSDDPLLEVENLTVQYKTKEGISNSCFRRILCSIRRRVLRCRWRIRLWKEHVVTVDTQRTRFERSSDERSDPLQGEEIQDLSEQELNQRIRWKEIAYIPRVDEQSRPA